MKMNNKKDTLGGYNLKAEDSHPKHYISPELGKKKPWHVRTFAAIKEFIRNEIAAIKEITRRVT